MREEALARPNFFDLLGLNPDGWNPQTFDETLKRKVAEWEKNRTRPGQIGEEASTNLSLLKEIQRIMVNPDEQKKEASAARKLHKAERERSKQRFEMQLRYLNQSPALEPSELENFIAAYIHLYSEEEIKQRITVRIGQGQSAPTPPLDASIRANIARLLALVGKSDLYDFLGENKYTDTNTLYKRAQALYTKLNKRGGSINVSHQKELIGYALDIFRSSEMHARYHETLKEAALLFIFDGLRETLKTIESDVVYAEQVHVVLDQAQQAGYDRISALKRLKTYAVEYGWVFYNATHEEMQQRLCCGNCKALNDAQQEFCTRCGQRLSILCPQCSHRATCEQRRCGFCDFPVGNRYFVDAKLQKVKKLLNQEHISAARDLLHEVENVWRPDPISIQDERLQLINEYGSEIAQSEQSRQQARELLNRLEHAVQHKQFYAANAILPALTAREQEKYEVPIRNALEEAQRLLRQAQLKDTPHVEKIMFCRQALQYCIDFEEARRLLMGLPPPPPAHLIARVREKRVSLSWEPSPLPKVIYIVVCQQRVPADFVRQGRVLTRTTECSYDDLQPVEGTPLYYSVFAAHETGRTSEGCIYTEPILLSLSNGEEV